MNSKAAKPMLLHGALVTIGLVVGTFSNHFGSVSVSEVPSGTSVAELEGRDQALYQSVSAAPKNRLHNNDYVELHLSNTGTDLIHVPQLVIAPQLQLDMPQQAITRRHTS